ncbi:hypothetical protein [Prauserella endophytica]|uniref:Uncharacterized protein n=1 Tax=Prauserella endophytica TaxID=1592324 RepID=A0ABY2S0H9_9PSEU|nr:hypothetical protein [Prauserella endophytica]PXY20342.1 hypothetical protein BAY59_31385 [Prauserella coralliicola]TKG66944.1 hypothetical protein FCN18_23830 [Prauserella endophytica]
MTTTAPDQRTETRARNGVQGQKYATIPARELSVGDKLFVHNDFVSVTRIWSVEERVEFEGATVGSPDHRHFNTSPAAQLDVYVTGGAR